MRDEIGKLREQARISEKNQEVMRAKCQQLAKQIKDFEMVLSRNAADRRANNDKSTPPIKINRSVGLQVNFMTVLFKYNNIIYKLIYLNNLFFYFILYIFYCNIYFYRIMACRIYGNYNRILI